MNAFYKLACAMVAWSTLSVATDSRSIDELRQLPDSAFLFSPAHPDRCSYIHPDSNLASYHSVLITPLTLLGKQAGDWQLQTAG